MQVLLAVAQLVTSMSLVHSTLANSICVCPAVDDRLAMQLALLAHGEKSLSSPFVSVDVADIATAEYYQQHACSCAHAS